MSRVFGLTTFCVLLMVAPAVAQIDQTQPLKPAVRVSRAQEIALARTAAPSLIAERAGIWVLGERGYEKAVEGSNGFGCIVQRGTSGQSLIPRCDEASGVSALFPLFFLLEELRLQCKSDNVYRVAVS